MNVRTDNKILVTADELEEGNRVSGKLSGETYEIILVQTGADDILGTVVRVWFRNLDFPEMQAEEYTFRPFDKLWILA